MIIPFPERVSTCHGRGDRDGINGVIGDPFIGDERSWTAGIMTAPGQETSL